MRRVRQMVGVGAIAFATAAVPCAWGQADSNPVPAQTSVAAPTATAGGTIRGTAKAGPIPLPGVSITATNTLTGKKYATTTDVTGTFVMAIPRNGRYVVKADLAAFASVTQETLINASGENGGKPEQTVEFGLQLASRVAQQQEQQTAAASTAVNGLATGLATALGRGVQPLSVTGGEADSADASAGAGNAGAQMPTLAGMGGGEAAATESVAVSGAVGTTNGLANFNEDEIRQRVEDAMAQARAQGGASADLAGAVMNMIGGMMGGGGGFGGPGGGFGGPGGGGRGGRGGGGGGGGGFRNFNPTQVHGAFAYTGANGALNATQFSPTGIAIPKPPSSRNSFIGSLTGSPYIPGLTKPNPKQFMFVSVQSTRNTTPSNTYAIVPTVAQRLGDLSTAGTVYDPKTGQPYGAVNCLPALYAVNAAPTACVPQSEITSSGQALLNYYPLPNIAPTGAQQNYQTITTATTHSSQASARFNGSFGQAPVFGGRGGGGRGLGQQNQNASPALRQSIAESFAYQHSAASSQNFSPQLGGKSESDGYSLSSSYTVGYGRLNSTASVSWNRSRSTGANYFTNTATNPAVAAGIYVADPAIYTNPFYFGVPSVNLTQLSGLSNVTPSDRVSQTISFSDFVSYRFRKHNVRVGFDVRRTHADSIGGTPVLGSFTFSGYATQNPAAQSCVPSSTQTCNFPASGSPIADLLIGQPQQTSVQAGLNKLYLRANVLDWYAQDDFRVLANVTLNLGLRWEYFSPYVEKYNRLTNLKPNADFSSITEVCATAASGCTVGSPRSLVNPDRTMYSPRIGIAWQPKTKFTKQTVVRAGYGINYNTGQYAAFAQSLAFQQPFAETQTNTLSSAASTTGCTLANMTLAHGFGCSTQATQSNYAVNPNYRLGLVQVWNLDIQRTLPQGIVLNIGYNGGMGGDLDIVRGPNRTASGVLNPASGQFRYEDSLGYSRINALAINARKRLQKGISLQATYTYAHSIDNASSIGQGSTSIAQDDRNLSAEESNSSFDIRHKLTGNWLYELPFGPNRTFLAKGGVWSRIFDGYSISGDFTFATGAYGTPVYSGTTAEIASGAGNSLRPNRVTGRSVTGPGTLKQWFNTAAFSAPATGTYGNASRNSIQLPGTVQVNGSLARTVSLGEMRSFEARVTATNAFNTVQYSAVGTTINSPTFGQVLSAASMRQLSFVARFRF